jgi:hypothetical protein
MYSVIRRYQGDAATQDELTRRVGETGRELITTIPGFISYALGVDGKGTLVTVGHFDDKTGADESSRRAAAWVREQASDLRVSPPSITEGELRLRRVAAGVEPKYGVMRRYQVDPRNVEEIVRRATEGFVPIITQAPGFATYNVIDVGNGTIVSISSFASKEQADNSTRQAAAWVGQNIGPLAPNPPEVTSAEVKVLWRK